MDRKNRQSDLVIAERELAFQNEEKEKRAAELVIANQELLFQNKEKEKRAAELVIANKELIFQNEEKEKRAAELVIANEELIFQNEEKEKRAAELIISTLAGSVQRKKNEEYIERLAAIVESSDDAIISKSLDGTIKSWNRGGEKMFGYTSKEAIDKNISLIIPPEFVSEEKNILEKICKNETIDHFETTRIKKNGERIYVAITVSPLKDKAGKIVGISKIVRDITQRKKAEEELIHANKKLVSQNEEKEKRAAELIIANKELDFQNKEKEKRAAELIIANKELLFQNEEKEKRASELLIANEELLFQNEEKGKRAMELESVNKELESFSYSVSHDLRAPLRAINGFTRVLMEDYMEQLDEEAKGVMDDIIENSNKMGELIDNLLGFSRISKQQVMMVNVSIKDIVNNLIAEFKREDPERIVNITIKKLEDIMGDRRMLKQVFINLISNAFKYTGKKEKTDIEIGSYPEENFCTYYIRDNGAGFDMRYYDKLFGVFQRMHSSNEFEGTGVGLAIIQRIITKHGGKVWAEGKVNEGACFYISLPKSKIN
ncbi:MAG: PAS domain S-box protein [Bacteroidota bacterium]